MAFALSLTLDPTCTMYNFTGHIFQVLKYMVVIVFEQNIYFVNIHSASLSVCVSVRACVRACVCV